jgi:DNA (cytosine-5)-methyltransferase 1
MRPRLLELFCGAGGAAMGYSRAGFDVVGVDIKPQPHYPFEFHQADALMLMDDLLEGWPIGGFASGWLLSDFAAVHASPPCQPRVKGLRAVNASLGRAMRHADLIDPTRDRLIASSLPYVIENAEGALHNAAVLCGTSFGLPVRRHRDIETSVGLLVPPCAHGLFREPRYWTSWRPNGETRRATTVQVYGNGGEAHEWGPAMGIDWMTTDELKEAIPPAYTEWIGAQLLASIERAA